MRISLNTKYRTLTVHFIIHASLPLQFKLYKPMFVITISRTSNLTFLQIHRNRTHRIVTVQHPKRRQKISQAT